MGRGRLRVYLGSSPGVGKTYQMLDEGFRRRERGTDVVVGFVETHGRPKTDAQVRDLEVLPRMSVEYRGTRLEEMDLEALLDRKPQVALVDEFAHTNVPGSTNEKRWMDVETLLDAGIDVITTVNIQHLESVNDVVKKITGTTQQETVPDVVVRRAEQIELVDVTPEALRRRMAHGNIYSADKIDTSLSNYFRVGNLTALRELALLWLADRVEDALQQYQDDHDIDHTWETRERLVVGVTGSPVDEVLLRRAARIASRTGAKVLAVHVINPDGVHHDDSDTSLARALVLEFEGTFHELVDDDTARALVSFARSERGTQIVLGTSRPRSVFRPFGGVVEHVLRATPDFDVHVISLGTETPSHQRRRRRRRRPTVHFSWRRQVTAFVLGITAIPLLTLVLADARASLSLSTDFLVYLVVVLALTTGGGAVVGVASALAAFALENYYFVKPLHTLKVSRPNDAVSLAAFLLFAVGASVVVSRFARRSLETERARAEAHVLAAAATNARVSHEDLAPLLDSLRAVFGATTVAVVTTSGAERRSEVVIGEPLRDESPDAEFVIDDVRLLVVHGVRLDEEDRQLVQAFAQRLGTSFRAAGALRDATDPRVGTEAEASRSGLLRAVTCDFRESLATMGMKMDALLDGEVTAPAKVQRERLLAVDVQVRRLTRLVDDLADVRRLESNSVTPHVVPTSIEELIEHAIMSVAVNGHRYDVDTGHDLPPVATDPAMAQRALSIVLANAGRFSPRDLPVRVVAGVTNDVVELLVIDRGPGVSEQLRTTIVKAVPRVGGEQRGANLGLSVVTSFVRLLGGRLRFEDTPGGGLTVIIELPLHADISSLSTNAE